MIKKDTYQFLTNVFTLLSGSSIAQVISVAALIILQRFFYSPGEYAPFRLFFEFSAAFSSVSALRLESGLILEKKQKDTLLLLRTCIKYCMYTSIIGGLVFTFYYLQEKEVFKYEWAITILMPLAIFANGIIQISQQFFTKSKQFITISSSKIIHSLVGGITQIITGIMGFSFIGLIIGRISGLLSADLNYIRSFFKVNKWSKKNKSEERKLISKHKKFILFTSPGVFIGNSINLLILVLFTHFYGEKFTGLTAAAIQYLGIIIMLFSSSFSQVYYNEIAQISNPKKLISSYVFWIKRLLLLSISGWVILFFTPSSVVVYILGEKWSDLLSIIKIISPWMGIMFIASSLSYVFIRLGKQKEIFFFDLFHLIIVLICIFTSDYLFDNKISTLYSISAVQSIFYVLSIVLAYRFLIKNLKIK